MSSLLSGGHASRRPERDQYIAAEALEPTTTATSVRVRDGHLTVTDGPFAETKEALGGFYLLDCADLDEAIEMAAKIPAARRGNHRSSADLAVARRVTARAMGAARADRPADRRRRSEPVPRGVRPRPRGPDPHDQGLRAGRGIGPGRVRHGARAVASRWPAAEPRSMDRDDGPEPGHRSPPARPDARRQDRGPRAGPVDRGRARRGGAGREGRSDADRG